MSTTRSGTLITPVAFLINNAGKDWQGGINYFRALFLAITTYQADKIKPVVFVPTKAITLEYQFPDLVKVHRTNILQRMSPIWVLNKLSVLLFRRALLLEWLLRRRDIRVLSHAPPAGGTAVRNVAWIPDFQHIHLPHFFSQSELRTRDRVFRSLIEGSNLIIVSSESARRDLIRFCPAHGTKARVLQFAAIPPIVDPIARLDLAKVHGITRPFFYLPNQAWTHKNHITAIRALSLLRELPHVNIICSGSLDDYRNPQHQANLLAAIDHYGVTDRFRMLGKVPYSHIPELMLQSVAVINPSLFEGWSTTVEEAKALGVPLVLSDIPVHREQCAGLPAFFFEPLDPHALALVLTEAASVAESSAESVRLRFEQAQKLHRQRMEKFANDFRLIAEELAEQL